MATSGATPFPTSSVGTDDGMTPSSSSNATDATSATSTAGSEGNGASPTTSSRPPNELLDRVVQGAHEAIDRLAEGAAPHVQRLQQGVASATDTLQERAGQAREMGDEWTESLRCTVRENPLAAVAAALVAGLLIARLTQR